MKILMIEDFTDGDRYPLGRHISHGQFLNKFTGSIDGIKYNSTDAESYVTSHIVDVRTIDGYDPTKIYSVQMYIKEVRRTGSSTSGFVNFCDVPLLDIPYPFTLEQVMYPDGVTRTYVNGKSHLITSGAVHGLFKTYSRSYAASNRWTITIHNLIVAEIDPVQDAIKRIGAVRIERMPVDTISGRIDSEDNIKGVIMNDSVFAKVYEDPVDITFTTPVLGINESVLAIDYRLAAIASVDSSHLKVGLTSGLESTALVGTVEELPRTVTQTSSCIYLKPHTLDDYNTVTLTLNSLEG